MKIKFKIENPKKYIEQVKSDVKSLRWDWEDCFAEYPNYISYETRSGTALLEINKNGEGLFSGRRNHPYSHKVFNVMVRAYMEGDFKLIAFRSTRRMHPLVHTGKCYPQSEDREKVFKAIVGYEYNSMYGENDIGNFSELSEDEIEKIERMEKWDSLNRVEDINEIENEIETMDKSTSIDLCVEMGGGLRLAVTLTVKNADGSYK